MSFQDKIKMFNQKKLPNNNMYDKNYNFTFKEVIKPNDLTNENKNKEIENKDIKKETNENNQKGKEQNTNDTREKSFSIHTNKLNFNNIISKIENNIKKIPSDNNNKNNLDKKISNVSNLSNSSSNLSNPPSKEINKEKESIAKNPEISKSMAEKMKSLELYFKLRNEGSRTITENPKSLDKNDNNINNNMNNNNTNIIKITLERATPVKDEWVKFESEGMVKLQSIQDAFEFNEEYYKERRYEKDNIESGKKFFRLRFIKNKINLEEKKIEGEKNEQKEQSIDKERILRKYNSEFLLTVEKSILSFNLKKYKESYEFLELSGIIKNAAEYGEFLLVVSGFDKFLVGEFLAKQKFPNDKKEVLNSFIESINMDNEKIKFLECLRFLFSRLILPKDANLILEIMDKFSVTYFEINKNDKKFVNIFKSSDKIYLLVSTILALNTMFTRKDIKIKNVIKKDEFIKMNVDISQEFIDKLYEELKKNPISMSDDYNESVYRNLAPLVKEDEGNKNIGGRISRISNPIEENRDSNLSTEEKQEEINNNNNSNNNNININKDLIVEEQIHEDKKNAEEFSNNDSKKEFNKKEFSLNKNLKEFTEEDKMILKTPHKFYKISGSNKSNQREYLITDDLTKLYYNQKQKKLINLSNLTNVYNGINHNYNSNIKKFLKSNPNEEQFSGNFISLIFGNEKKQLDLMSDNLESALLWFKAIKSLLNSNDKSIKKDNDNSFENSVKQEIKKIWTIIINNWDFYGRYLLLRLMERNRQVIHKEEKPNNIVDQKNISFKHIESFLKNINLKISKMNKIESNEFSNLYNLGIPEDIRKNIWQILIGNPYVIYDNSYEHIKKQIIKIDFNNIDLNNLTNNNFCQDYISNNIINEIFEIKEIFFSQKKEEANLNQNSIMTQVYNISRAFFIFRQDIPFNKSIISITFLLLFVFVDETRTFINLVNLVCSNILNILIGNKKVIKNSCRFFQTLLAKYLPKIEKHFSKLEITPQLYMIPWFEELFSRTIDYKLLSHIIDLYLINGEYVLYQTSLTILKSFEEDLISLTINDIFKILQKFPENTTESSFIYRMRNFSSVKKDFFEWKIQNEIDSQKELFKSS